MANKISAIARKTGASADDIIKYLKESLGEWYDSPNEQIALPVENQVLEAVEKGKIKIKQVKKPKTSKKTNASSTKKNKSSSKQKNDIFSKYNIKDVESDDKKNDDKNDVLDTPLIVKKPTGPNNPFASKLDTTSAPVPKPYIPKSLSNATTDSKIPKSKHRKSLLGDLKESRAVHKHRALLEKENAEIIDIQKQLKQHELVE
jgi:hypothetical protein